MDNEPSTVYAMVAWEAAVLAAARAVTQRAAAAWLADRRSAAERSKELTELISLRVRDRFRRRSLERQIEEIADAVAQRLEPLFAHEFGGLADNERTAALLAVVDAFNVADLSDEALFAVDLDGTKLARDLMAIQPITRTRVTLTEPAARFLDLVLSDCCNCYVQVVQQLASFGPRASVETLDRLSRIGEQVALVLERLPAPRGSANRADADRDFELRYVKTVSSRLDELELFGVDVHRYRPRTTVSVAYISLTVTSADTIADRDQHRQRTLAAKKRDEGWHRSGRLRDVGTVRVASKIRCK